MKQISYSIANKMTNRAESLDKIIDLEDWLPIVQAGQSTIAKGLISLTALTQLRKYKKHPRGRKKTATPRMNNPRQPRVATTRLLKK